MGKCTNFSWLTLCVGVLSVWLCLSVAASAATLPVYTLTHDSPPMQDFNVYLQVDASGRLTIDQVAGQAQAQAGRVASVRQVYQAGSHYWFGFRLHNASDKPLLRILAFDESFLYRAELYRYHHSRWLRDANGLQTPLSQRSTPSQLPAFAITLQPGETGVFYLLAMSKSSQVNVGLTLIERAQFISQQRVELILYAIFIGILLAMAVYNFFIFISLRDISYLFYVGHVGFFLVFFIAFSGFDLLLDVSAQTHFRLFALALSGSGFLLLFTRHFLQTARAQPRVDRLLLGMAFAFFILALLAWFDIQFYAYAVSLTLPAMLIQAYVGVMAWKQGQVLARYYLFGIGWYIMGLFLLAAQGSGWLAHNDLTRYGFMFGSLFEVFLFSFALAYRVKLLQQQRDTYQRELIAQQQSENQRLEELVVERTSELTKLNRELSLLAQRDGLTGLYNRRYFDSAIVQAWQLGQIRNESLCVLMCDIDYFKAYNDQLGHQAGDECIRRVVKSMLSALSQEVELVARYGGEEFAILMRGCDVALARHLAEQARLSVADMRIVHPASPMGYVTASFGLACREALKTDVEALIYAADQALYQSKTQGRNRVSVAS